MVALALVLLIIAPSIVLATYPANSTCQDSWLFVDIHNRLTDGKPDFYQYGLFMGVGTPSQNMSLWPSLSHNESRLASYRFCEGSTVPDCLESTHARFESTGSSSWQNRPQNGTPGALSSTTNITYGTDDLHIYSHFFESSPASKTTLNNQPISYLSNYRSKVNPFFSSSALGLGPSSYTLSSLVAAGRVSRRVIGMYLGTAYARAGGDRNGSIVFGGYDAGQIDGPAHEYQRVAVPAPGFSSLRVRVKQVALVTSDGSSIPLVTDDGFDGYLSTEQYAVEFPGPVTQALATAMRAAPANNAENTLRASEHFVGNLTIALDDGYQITYPSDWLTNTSNLTPISASTMNSSNTVGKPLVLGAAFLHHLYLTIDYESNTFSLAKAKMYNNYIQPTSLCSNTVPAPAPPPAISKFAKAGLAGAILGGVVGLFGISFMVFWVLRRNLQARASRKSIDETEKGFRGSSAPRKSSLRNKSRTVFARGNRKPKLTHSVSFLTPQKPSFESSSVASSDKSETAVTIPIEMTIIRRPTCALQIPIPTPSRSTFDAGRTPRNPTFVSVPTPTTSHALLNPQEQYSYIADDDNSDIPQQYLLSHPTTVPAFKKQKPILRIDTKAVRRGDRKPARLPIRVAIRDGNAGQTRETKRDSVDRWAKRLTRQR